MHPYISRALIAERSGIGATRLPTRGVGGWRGKQHSNGAIGHATAPAPARCRPAICPTPTRTFCS